MLVYSIVVSIFVVVVAEMYSPSESDYLQKRNRILKSEKVQFTGGNIKLSSKEVEVNKIILREKSAEMSKAHENITDFLPAQHFFVARKMINQSNVFSIIKNIPKGAALHTHLLAAVSIDFIMENITFRENLYGCDLNGTFKLCFMENPDRDNRCKWKSIKDYRENDSHFDDWLRNQMSLVVEDPYEHYPTPAAIWQSFKKIFTTQYDMMCYKPVFRDYVRQLLMELYLDNVMYTELRGTFMPLYELNGTVYDNQEFFKVFIETVEQFKADFPRFIGVRYIHSIYRGVAPEVLKSGLSELLEMKKLYPDFIAGFDFVGYEEEGKRLVDFHEILLEATKELKFFFHAGETNWFGFTDLNLIDAVLLNSSRIGHGFGLDKHPVVMEMARTKRIAIELCPISNQVLMLNADPRNHPAVSLMAKGFPVVISNDDPSVWGATGLSYDWYVVFMAMTPENYGLAVLKQFAMDSIKYSAMDDAEKIDALEKWAEDWEKFLDDMIRLHQLQSE